MKRPWPEFPNIVVDPLRLSGGVSIRGRRIFAHDIGQMALMHDYADIREGYDLTDAQIDEARAWFMKYGAETERYPEV